MAQPASAAPNLVRDPKGEVHDEHIDAGVAQANLVRQPDACMMSTSISMQSACNQHAISMQSACNQHAIRLANLVRRPDA